MYSLKDKHLTQLYGREIISLLINERHKLIEEAFSYWRKQGFPYINIEKEKLQKDFSRFVHSNEIIDQDKKTLSASSMGLSIANSFNPQMWEIPSQGHILSPIEHFRDDNTLKKLLSRAINFWPNRLCWSSYCIRNLFGIYAGGRIANFRPTVARFLINKYSKPKSTVLDYCAGFGGRFLGCLAEERHYIGIDTSKKQINSLKKMYSLLGPLSKSTCDIYLGYAEDILPSFKANSIELVFTSPPYYNLEKYDLDNLQSYHRYLNYTEWKDAFLLSTINESYRILKPNGYLIINIANTKKFQIADDFKKLAILQFKLKEEYSLLMTARPVQRLNGKTFRTEPILVFQKPN